MSEKHLYPNTFQFHNDYIDKYMPFLTDTEFRVLSYMVRRVVGFFRDEQKSRISLTQMVDGLFINGERQDYGVGASRPSVVKACKSLEKFGLIIRVDGGSKRDAIAAQWDVSFDKPEMIDFDAMVARKEAQVDANKRRAGKARASKSRPENDIKSKPDNTFKPSKADNTFSEEPSKADNTFDEVKSQPHNTIPSKRGLPPNIETKNRNQEVLADASPDSSSSDGEKTESEHQKFFGALCWVVGWDHHVITKEQKGQIAQALGILKKEGYTIDDLRVFWRDVWCKDWRYTKNGSRPTPTQVRAEIGKVKKAAAPEGFEEPKPAATGEISWTQMIAQMNANEPEYMQ